jgi:murein DD-endopeptidase MepM/ murein hydrolase activator NlpD
MRLSPNSFFDGEFLKLNLNHLFLDARSVIKDSKVPSQIQTVLDSLECLTYGGYGEDRKDVWAGTYMDEKKTYIHLGVDITVPAGTPIKCPFDAHVFDVFTDLDTRIGWGGRVILTRKGAPYLVLAHIDPESLVIADSYKQGDIIGRVGTWPTNGNTFNHLHVQAVHNLNISDFDGYGYVTDLQNNPDPFSVEF